MPAGKPPLGGGPAAGVVVVVLPVVGFFAFAFALHFFEVFGLQGGFFAAGVAAKAAESPAAKSAKTPRMRTTRLKVAHVVAEICTGYKSGASRRAQTSRSSASPWPPPSRSAIRSAPAADASSGRWCTS